LPSQECTHAALLHKLQAFQGGVADTSTLIYLERVGLLPHAARCFSLLLIPQVVAEFGTQPKGTVLVAAVGCGTTDAILCQTAQALGQPVLSEDKQVLRRARALNLSFYNTLMIVLAFCTQNRLPLVAFPTIRDELCTFAHYSPAVVAVGDALYQSLRPVRTSG
jgi:hypothetical protein